MCYNDVCHKFHTHMYTWTDRHSRSAACNRSENSGYGRRGKYDFVLTKMGYETNEIRKKLIWFLGNIDLMNIKYGNKN